MISRKILVAGAGSNVGKTTVALGLLTAYRDLGYQVQGLQMWTRFYRSNLSNSLKRKDG